MADGTGRTTRRLRPLLGTYVEIGVATSSNDEAAFETAYSAIAKVHGALSFQDRDSELSILNRSGREGVRMSALARRVLRLAVALGARSDGLFNCTVGGALVASGCLPDHGGAPPIATGSWRDIAIDGDRVRLRRPVRITLDGIAKGFAVDRAIAALRLFGVQAAWVNAGGDLRVFGDITLPISIRQSDGSLQSMGGLRNAALATSQFSDQDKARFPGHIIGSCDVREGAFTVLARSAWRADGLTKIAALASPADRQDIVERLGGRLIQSAIQIN